MGAYLSLDHEYARRSDQTDRARAWTEFWQEQPANSRCLRNASPEVHLALSRHWRDFGAGLPSSARVLDLGCGTGIVGRELGGFRPDLSVTGIDAARIPETHHRGVEIVSGTLMESLPFPSGSLDAAVSQFGFEYSRTALTAKELARVLKPRAPLSFLVHHGESPLAAAEEIYGRALQALTGDKVRSPFISADAVSLERELKRLKSDYPGSFDIALAGAGLLNRIGLDPAARIIVWNAVIEALAPELILVIASHRPASPRTTCVNGYSHLAPASVSRMLRL